MKSENFLNIAANRSAKKYSKREQLLRLMWWPCSVLFRLIPRPLYGLRVLLLRLFGAEVGHFVHIHNTAIITFPWNLTIGDYSAIGDNVRVYNLGKILIGSRVTISQHAHLCAGTHDYSQVDFPLIKPSIVIHDGAWVAADAFIGPGVKVGSLAIVGARACVFKDIPDQFIVGGNPAREIGRRPHSESGNPIQ